MRPAIAAIFLCGLLAPATAPAEVLRATLIPVTIEGGVDVQFQSAGAGACQGMCLSGAVTWSPGREAALSVYEERRGRDIELEGYLFSLGGDLFETAGPRTAARVSRAPGTGAPSLCSDVRSHFVSSLDFSAGERSRLLARFTGSELEFGSLLHTRCGGPLDADAAAALPARPVELDTLLRGGTTIHLSGERPFAARGLTGVVRSSVKLKLGKPAAPFERLRDPGAAESRERERPSLTASYRLERVAGDIVTNYGGTNERLLCAPLGACGVSGALRVRPLASSGTATFTAVASSRRATRRQLRSALGLIGGRRVKGITIFGQAEWTGGTGSVTGSFSAGGQTCTDTVSLPHDYLTFSFGRRRVFASYGRASPYGADPFANRCPGPALADLTHDHPLATGAVPLRAFRNRRVAFTLHARRPFESEPYRGQTSGELTVLLRRKRVGRLAGDGEVLIIRRGPGGRAVAG